MNSLRPLTSSKDHQRPSCMSFGDQKGEHLSSFHFSVKTGDKGAVPEREQGVQATWAAKDNWTVADGFDLQL